MPNQDSTDTNYEKEKQWVALTAWADAHGYELRLTRIWAGRGSWELEVGFGQGVFAGWGGSSRREVMKRALADIAEGLRVGA